jgi:hypothetical protein
VSKLERELAKLKEEMKAIGVKAEPVAPARLAKQFLSLAKKEKLRDDDYKDVDKMYNTPDGIIADLARERGQPPSRRCHAEVTEIKAQC